MVERDPQTASLSQQRILAPLGSYSGCLETPRAVPHHAAGALATVATTPTRRMKMFPPAAHAVRTRHDGNGLARLAGPTRDQRIVAPIGDAPWLGTFPEVFRDTARPAIADAGSDVTSTGLY